MHLNPIFSKKKSCFRADFVCRPHLPVIIFRCKDSVQTGTTLEVLTNGAAAQSSFIEPSGFAYGQK